MTDTFPLPLRRGAALGILAAGLLLLWSITVSPALELWDKAGSDSTGSGRLLATYQKSIRDEPQWAALLKTMQTGGDLYIDSADPDLAAAKLQQNIKRITEAAHGTIKSMQVLPAGKDQGLQRVGVRLSFTIPFERITEVLAEYDKERPYVFLDNLLMTAPSGNRDTGGAPPLLSVNCDFYSYLRPAIP